MVAEVPGHEDGAGRRGDLQEDPVVGVRELHGLTVTGRPGIVPARLARGTMGLDRSREGRLRARSWRGCTAASQEAAGERGGCVVPRRFP
jgi:hypothetical protein